MLCVECQQGTTAVPCSACGGEPRVGARYRLERRLGTGSFGVVYRGRDERTGAAVAVKEVLLGGLDTDKARELARREGSVLRQLSHPCIPGWRDELVVGVGRSTALYLVQDHVDGQNLQDGLASRRWSEDEVLKLMDEVLEVLDYLHSLHPPVVHRDLKPANLIRSADGRLMLVDFGAVREALRSSGMGGSTVVGTFGFMAPEQVQGGAEPATDLFGLGMTAVALLSRIDPARLHDGTGRVDWERHVVVSAPTTALLRALLQADPWARPRSADSVRRDIARARCGRVKGAVSTVATVAAAGAATEAPVAVREARVTSVYDGLPPWKRPRWQHPGRGRWTLCRRPRELPWGGGCRNTRGRGL